MTRSKTLTRTLTLASAALAAVLTVATPLHAQQPGTPQGGPRPGSMGPRSGMMAGHGNPASVDERVQRLSGELTLTPEQTARVKALFTTEQRSADSLRAVRAVQMEAERKAMDARHTEHEKALLAILTPEQKTRHEALMKQRMEHGSRSRGHGGHPHGGSADRRGHGNADGTR